MTAGPTGARLVGLADQENDTNDWIAFGNSIDGGVYDPGTQTVAWNIGDMTAGQTIEKHWQGTISCTATDGDSVDDTATALSPDGTGSDTQTVTVAVAELLVDKTVALTDTNANGILDPGETLTFTIAVTNDGSCVSGPVDVADTLDNDLDAAGIVASDSGNVAGRSVTWNALTTPALAAMAPAAVVTLTVSAQALDPATNPDPHDSSVDNTATASQPAVFGCTANQDSDALAGADVYVIGGGGGTTMIRNGAIGCRQTAIPTIRTEVILGPAQDQGINLAHPQSTSQPVPASGTVTFPGDGTPRAADACPEPSPTVDSRVLVFYELRGSAAPLTVHRAGADVTISW